MGVKNDLGVRKWAEAGRLAVSLLPGLLRAAPLLGGEC